MAKPSWMSFRFFIPFLVVTLLVVGVACGEAATTAPEATSPPAATEAPTQAPDPTDAPETPDSGEDTATPVPTPEVTEAPEPTEPPAPEGPHGHLRVAFGDIGSYQAHPCTTGSPAVQFITMTAFEGLVSQRR